MGPCTGSSSLHHLLKQLIAFDGPAKGERQGASKRLARKSQELAPLLIIRRLRSVWAKRAMHEQPGRAGRAPNRRAVSSMPKENIGVD